MVDMVDPANQVYDNKIKEEKELFKKYTLIDIGKVPHENYILSLTKKGFLLHKDNFSFYPIMNIICGIDQTNLNLIEIYDIWHKLKYHTDDSCIFSTYYFSRLAKLYSYLIFDLRTYIDTFITLVYLFNTGGLGQEIIISDIGNYLYNIPSDKQLFKKFNSFFNIINDLSNSYKHSFLNNYSFQIFGRDEVCIPAIYAKHNKDLSNPKNYLIPVKQLVNDFTVFFHFAMDTLKNLSNDYDNKENNK